jgi:sulfur-oxidizing protein SoxY
MKTLIVRILLTFTLLHLSGFPLGAMAEGEDETQWTSHLKHQFFGDRPISEDQMTIEITAPYRAEDPALVPIQITSKFPQTEAQFIKKVTVIIDHNPTPFSASFEFTRESGKADIATRMRVNAYSYIRAIAETNEGTLHMAKTFIKASGGCSAPIGTDSEAAKARFGKMKFKFDQDKLSLGSANAVQLLISHPNITGMQMDQISRMTQPAEYVTDVRVTFDGNPIMTVKGDIALSTDPNFRFYFVPGQAGELKVDIKDNLGHQFSANQSVNP